MITLVIKIGVVMGLFAMVPASAVDTYIPVLNGLHTEVGSLMDPVINTIKGFINK